MPVSDTIALSTQDLTKSYGKGDNRFTALDHLTLAIQQGESVAIVGKSGSGKSTLMHLLALLDKPTEGNITISGSDAAKLSGRQLNKLRNREFGFVFQQFFLNANATVLENVILPLKIAGIGARERNRRGRAVLEQVELADKAKNKASALSGGQKQRVVIARALINDPNIIFADEPTGNLDSVTGERVTEILFDLHRTKHITLIIVTHDEDLAARCDRQLHIKDGQLLAETTAPTPPAPRPTALPRTAPAATAPAKPRPKAVRL